jgi:hypothetical protein
MVKVEIGGTTFFCDSADEAVRIHRLANAGVSAPTQQATAVRRPSGMGRAFLKKIEPHVGKEVSSEELAKIIGAKSKAGLGPKLFQLRKNLADDNVVLDDFIVKKKLDAMSPTSWMIAKRELS